MYFNLREYLEKYPNKFYYAFLGGRGTGKSFDIKDNIFKDFIEKGEQAIILRRYVNQIDDIKENYLDDLLKVKYPEEIDNIEYKNDSVLYKGKPFIFFMGLNKKGAKKASAFPYVTKVIYEEFTPQAGETYLKDEYKRLEALLITMDRFEDRITCFLLGNFTTSYNPVFQAMKLYPPLNFGAKENSDMVIVKFPTSEELATKQTNTRLGRVTKRSGTWSYNIGNENLSNEMFNVINKKEFFKITNEKKDRFDPVITCKIEDKKYLRLWQGTNYKLFVDITNKPSHLQCFYDFDNQDENNIHISMVEHITLDTFSYLLKQGRVFFSTIEAKTLALQIFTFNDPI